MRRILLVDDEPNVLAALRRSLIHALAGEGLRIEIFEDPRAALARAIEVSFDVVFSDYRMPSMNGVDFLKAFRELQPETVRIVLSASTEFNAVSAAINEAEVFRYLSKPWDAEELEKSIRQALVQRDRLLEDQRLADEMRLQRREVTPQEIELRRLEQEEPGITRVRWGPDGSVLLEED